ncbi:MAG: T9SS type A sorting domain-containing protein [Bacteroidota bacterium]
MIASRLFLRQFFFLPFIFLSQYSSAQSLLTGMPTPDGSVYSFERDGNTIYIGGFFQNVNSIPHGSLARFDAITGTLDAWNPSVDANGVTCLANAGSKLIAGGSFTAINGQTRYGICMFDLVTGNLDSWSDTANYASWRMGIGTYNNYFYYAHLGQSWDCRIVCVDANTGSFVPWQSDSLIYGNVNAIYASGSYVYVGGQFTLNGVSSMFDNLCRFDQSTGALDLSWHPNPVVNNFGVTAIVKTNNEIFVGGDFNTIAGQSRKGVAGFDAAGNLTSFNQTSSSYEVLSLYGDGDFIWVGGNSWQLGGASRYRLAQIRISNAQATCWDASATTNTWSTAQAILVKGDTVYAGPFGSPSLSVFGGNPLPLQGDTISGPDAVIPFQSAMYSVPNVAGNIYSWNVTGGSGTSTTNSINVTWGAGPTGTVSVTVNNPSAGNCSADTSLQVSISTGTLVNPIDENDEIFSVYPNPSEGMFTVKVDGKNIHELQVFDLFGREIIRKKTVNNPCTLQLRDLPAGVYQLRVVTEDGLFSKKLVKTDYLF